MTRKEMKERKTRYMSTNVNLEKPKEIEWRMCLKQKEKLKKRRHKKKKNEKTINKKKTQRKKKKNENDVKK